MSGSDPLLLLPAGRTTGRGRGSGGGMRTVAPAISAFGPLHARQGSAVWPSADPSASESPFPAPHQHR